MKNRGHVIWGCTGIGLGLRSAVAGVISEVLAGAPWS